MIKRNSLYAGAGNWTERCSLQMVLSHLTEVSVFSSIQLFDGRHEERGELVMYTCIDVRDNTDIANEGCAGDTMREGRWDGRIYVADRQNKRACNTQHKSVQTAIHSASLARFVLASLSHLRLETGLDRADGPSRSTRLA